MPLTKKGIKLKKKFIQEYGAKKGKQVFYASEKKGTIKGIKKNKKKRIKGNTSERKFARGMMKIIH